MTIHNTFAIVVAQRTRENALLRALGADRRQVLGATLAEALVVGFTASAAGLLCGIGVATGLKALFRSFGFALPTGGMVISATAIALPLAVGTRSTPSGRTAWRSPVTRRPSRVGRSAPRSASPSRTPHSSSPSGRSTRAGEWPGIN